MSIVVLKQAPSTPEGEKVDYSGSGPWFVVEATAEGPKKFAKAGPASLGMTPEDTLINVMKQVAAKKPSAIALRVERINGLPPALDNDKVPAPMEPEQWTEWTYAQYLEDVRKVAKGFMAYGFGAFSTVNVWGFNSPEWKIASYAGCFAGGKVGGIYPTDTPDTVAYKIVHSSGSIVCVDDASKATKLVAALNERKDCVHVKAVVAWAHKPADGETLEIEGCGKVPFISWQELIKKGEEVTDQDLDDRANAVKPQHCGVLVYTSGTTGDPKAVMLSHDNMIFGASNLINVVSQSSGLMKAGVPNRVMSYLPLSHVAGCINDMVATLVGTNILASHATVSYARVYDIKKSTIGERIGSIHPTSFFAVPLVYEKIADKIKAIGAAVSGTMQKVSGCAKGINLEYARNLQLGGTAEAPCCKCFADIIANKVKGRVGFDETRIFIVGAAPIRVDTLEYYGSLGMYINEAYGMSETTALASASTDQAHVWGSCGFELPGCETKIYRVDPQDMNKKTECPPAKDVTDIDESVQGEICFRGRHIMMGYLACPEMGEAHKAKMVEKTAETIDTEGWLHSGDKGLKTKSGMIKITGRYKELIIGAGGENIAPVPIEDNVKSLCAAINECMMIGDQRKFNVAIITLKAVGANGETPGTDDLDPSSKNLVPGVTKISEAMKSKEWLKIVEDAITKTNGNNKVCLNPAFALGKFTILPHNFSEENGELTPTKKLKRKVVEKIYNDVVEKMYKSTDPKERYIPF